MGLWKIDRYSPKTIIGLIHVQANNETKALNLLKFTKNIEIINQYAEIVEVTSAINMIDVYLDVCDDINSINITSPGADLSGLTVGCFFSKMENYLEELSFNFCDQVRFTEIKSDEIGQPFILTAKSGVDNFIRLNFTTNTILDFVMLMVVRFRFINGGILEFV